MKPLKKRKARRVQPGRNIRASREVGKSGRQPPSPQGRFCESGQSGQGVKTRTPTDLSTENFKKHSALRNIYGRCGRFARLADNSGRLAPSGGRGKTEERWLAPRISKPTFGNRLAFRIQSAPRRAGYPQIFPVLIARFAASTRASGDLLIG